MKKVICLLLVVLFGVNLVSCNSADEDLEIKVYTRDTTSGTRDGFFSTIGFNEAVNDNTVLVNGYVELSGNGEMISAIKNDEFSIGYISLSSLSSSNLKGLKYNGVEPTEKNVINGSYELIRNFNYNIRKEFATEKEKKLVEAFVAFLQTREGKTTILSKDGIVEIKDSDPSWESIREKFSIVENDNSDVLIKFGGSTSVEKIARALSAEFSAKAGNFKYEHNHTGSSDAYKRTQGSEAYGANFLHVGFASREYKLNDSEPLYKNTYGLLCFDAIVTVVNSKNKITSITTQNLLDIYRGNITKWKELD